MNITVTGNIITPEEPGTLYRNREAIGSGPGPFTVDSDGVYFVEDTPCLVHFQTDGRRKELWQSFLDSQFREDLLPYTNIRRIFNAARTLFAKNDFYGADQKINSWK